MIQNLTLKLFAQKQMNEDVNNLKKNPVMYQVSQDKKRPKKPSCISEISRV